MNVEFLHILKDTLDIGKKDFFKLRPSSSKNTSFCLSVCLSVTPFSLCSGYRIIMKFSGVITNDKRDVHAKTWSSIEEVPYCFSRLFVKFQGRTAPKFVEFDPNWAFPDYNSNLNSPMGTKWYTKLEVAYKRCPILFLGSSVKSLGHTAQ